MVMAGDIQDPVTESRRSSLVISVIFYLFLLILIVTHVIIFLNSNMVIDSDQTFLWAGVKDYAEGKFYEPRFYGQDYNTFMESLFAVPFYKLGMPVYYALPLATHLIFLTPVLFTAFYLFFRKRKLNAVLVLAIFICLTTAFDILTSIPRGFVTGIFFSTFYVVSYCNPYWKKGWYLNAALSVLGFYINPNILVAAAPLYFYLWLLNYKKAAFYLTAVPAALTAFFCYQLFDKFYADHPEYVIYGLTLDYSLEYFLQNITHLDECFAHISFFFEDNCTTLLLMFTLFLIILWRQEKVRSIAFLFFLVFLLLSFFTGKTREGSLWPFYSYSRMYLAVPFVLSGFVALIKVSKDTLFSLAVAASITFSAYKLYMMKRVIAYHTFHLHATGVRIVPLAEVLDGMQVYKKACLENGAKRFVVSTIFWQNTNFTYGGPAVYDDFPPTQETNVDRRYWVRELQKNEVCDRFVFLSIKYDLDKMVEGKYPFEIKRLDDYGLFLIFNNRLRNGQFMELMRDLER